MLLYLVALSTGLAGAGPPNIGGKVQKDVGFYFQDGYHSAATGGDGSKRYNYTL